MRDLSVQRLRVVAWLNDKRIHRELGDPTLASKATTATALKTRRSAQPSGFGHDPSPPARYGIDELLDGGERLLGG